MPFLRLLALVLLAIQPVWNQATSGPGVVVQRGCATVQCAPNFVCVTRNTPPVGELPFCVPGNSALCTQIQCPPGQTCIFVEVTNCGSASCTPVARCALPGATIITTPPVTPTRTTTTTTGSTITTTGSTTTTRPTTTTTRRTTLRPTTTTTRRTTATTTRRTTFTTRPTRPTTTTRTTTRFTTTRRPATTRRPTTTSGYDGRYPGIHYCITGYYGNPDPAALGYVRPAGVISIPSPISNPRPVPNFPIPPPGYLVPGNPPPNSGPPPVAPLPQGVRPPAPPRMTGSAPASRPSTALAPSRPSSSRPSPPSSPSVSAPASPITKRIVPVQTATTRPTVVAANGQVAFEADAYAIPPSMRQGNVANANRKPSAPLRPPKRHNKRSKGAVWTANHWKQEITTRAPTSTRSPRVVRIFPVILSRAPII
ncbi:hypothetical protein GCK32_002512 [Trichostrongylus colubriformis]|uniref:Uncharacterized protein n=1 Tax=Trichostrongylus colubriformis TaxID=6319 RepID=A0AAN8ISD0_TRICO